MWGGSRAGQLQQAGPDGPFVLGMSFSRWLHRGAPECLGEICWRRYCGGQYWKIPIEGRLPSAILWFLLPPVLLFLTVILKGWQEVADDAMLSKLLKITAGFYVVCALAMSAIFLPHGGMLVWKSGTCVRLEC